MKRRRLIAIVALLAAALLLPAAPVLADEGPGDGLTVWNEDYTVQEGESIDGDLVVLNGDLFVEGGGRVGGTVVVWNGNAEINGTVEGDLVVSNGDIELGDEAWVEGSVVCSWNCSLSQGEGAHIEDGVIEGNPLEQWRGIPVTVPSITEVWRAGPGLVARGILNVARTVLSVLVVSGIAGVVALIWPDHLRQVSDTVVDAPAASFGVGLLTALAAVVLAIAAVITICLPFFIGLALVITGLFGWICMGALVGERLLQALKAQQATPLWAAVIGTFLISVIVAGIGLVPCVGVFGGLIAIVLGCLGVGAVVLTRFGSQSFPLGYGPEAASETKAS